jgi:hypothetical protein
MAGADLKIIQKPIVFDDLRMNLTLEYIQKHYGDKISGESVPDIPMSSACGKYTSSTVAG